MKLIKELTHNSENIETIVEEKQSGEKKYYIEGIFMQAEIKNRNGRIYPLKTMVREFNRYKKEYVDDNRATGELGHPDNPTINPDRISHKIVDMWQEGNDFYARAEILDTPMGKIAKSLIDGGVKLGVSTRGLGSVSKRGNTTYVGEDFYLVTAGDIVADPSAPSAFVKSIVESTVFDMNDNEVLATDGFVNGILEGREFTFKNGKIVELDESIDEELVLEKFTKLLKTL